MIRTQKHIVKHFFRNNYLTKELYYCILKKVRKELNIMTNNIRNNGMFNMFMFGMFKFMNMSFCDAVLNIPENSA